MSVPFNRTHRRIYMVIPVLKKNFEISSMRKYINASTIQHNTYSIRSAMSSRQYTKSFLFKDDHDELRVSVFEVMDPSYGMYVWPSAPVLAQFIWHRRELVHGKQVLEIGAGTALPGIVAALLGGHVILTDSSNYPQCNANCLETCRANGLTDVQVLQLTWGRIDHTLLTLPQVDIVLASDCFYDEKDFEDILVTVAFIIERNPNAEFWCTYQERSSDRNIEFLLNRWDLVCEPISLSSFDAAYPEIAGSDLPGDHTIHMYIIRKR